MAIEKMYYYPIDHPAQKEQQRYEINEKMGTVTRLSLSGERLGHVYIATMRSKRELIRDLSRFPKEAVQTYLIARDECIDRGLISNEED